MKWVFERSQARGVPRLVLLSIANYVDEQYLAWPGLTLLETMTQAARSSVVKAVAVLEKSGDLAVRRAEGPKGVNLYAFDRMREEVEKGIWSFSGLTEAASEASGLPVAKMVIGTSAESDSPPDGDALSSPTTLPLVAPHDPEGGSATLPAVAPHDQTGSVTGSPTTLPLVASPVASGSVALPEPVVTSTATPTPAAAGPDPASPAIDFWALLNAYVKRSHFQQALPEMERAVSDHGYETVLAGTVAWSQYVREHWSESERNQYAPAAPKFFGEGYYLNDPAATPNLKSRREVRDEQRALNGSARQEPGSDVGEEQMTF